MDSITQGVLGAAAAQAVMGRRLPRGAGLIGAIAGMAADLDVFIQSANDPTLHWLFHRHFTHSLFFIPIGGLLAALPFLFLARFADHKRGVILASIVGYATHAPLDMFTSYGTQLFWPLTDFRVALDWIAIVDPVYTIPLWIGVIATARTHNLTFVRAALLLTTVYLVGFGAWQHARAAGVQQQLLAARGHRADHARVMPAPGWLLLWRSVYIAEGRLYADGIRTPWLASPRVREGESADAVTFEDLSPAARNNAEARRRFEILRWFSGGWLAPVNGQAHVVGDMRITAAVEGLTPLWGLQFDARSGEATAWRPNASIARDYRGLLQSLFLGDPHYLPLNPAPKSI
jgi:inner membrane protein